MTSAAAGRGGRRDFPAAGIAPDCYH